MHFVRAILDPGGRSGCGKPPDAFGTWDGFRMTRSRAAASGSWTTWAVLGLDWPVLCHYVVDKEPTRSLRGTG